MGDFNNTGSINSYWMQAYGCSTPIQQTSQFTPPTGMLRSFFSTQTNFSPSPVLNPIHRAPVHSSPVTAGVVAWNRRLDFNSLHPRSMAFDDGRHRSDSGGFSAGVLSQGSLPSSQGSLENESQPHQLIQLPSHMTPPRPPIKREKFEKELHADNLAVAIRPYSPACDNVDDTLRDLNNQASLLKLLEETGFPMMQVVKMIRTYVSKRQNPK